MTHRVKVTFTFALSMSLNTEMSSDLERGTTISGIVTKSDSNHQENDCGEYNSRSHHYYHQLFSMKMLRF